TRPCQTVSILDKLLRAGEGRKLKRSAALADYVATCSEQIETPTDDELRAKTDEFKGRLDGGETLDDLLPEAFAVAREAAQRVLGQKPYPVQLLGGIVLHTGAVAEMKTGEGKTLTCTLPSYLHALAG